MRNIDMRKHFTPNKYGAIPGTVPQNAWNFGLVIQDRKIRGSSNGLRRNAIPFQYLTDGAIPSLSKSANYDDITVPGRFEQIRSYQSSSAIDLSLGLTYVAEGSEESLKALGKRSPEYSLNLLENALLGETYFEPPPQTFWTVEQIERISAKIESLVFPQYDGSYAPPRFCLLNIGSIFIEFPVIVKTVEVQHVSPFTVRDIKPFRRNITLSLASYFPIYQAIGAKDILDIGLKTNFSASSRQQARSVYSYRKFSVRKR